jgi:hypothetical protein
VAPSTVTHGARRNATRGFNGRGGLQRWPKELGDGGHASRPSILAPSGGGCMHGHLALIRRRNPASRSAAPLRTSTSMRPSRARTLRKRLHTVTHVAVDVDTRSRMLPLMVLYGGVRRSAVWGPSGVASDNLHGTDHRRLGASAEGRLAWPQASSPSGHFCKPTRPQGHRAVLRRTPCAPSVETAYRVPPRPGSSVRWVPAPRSAAPRTLRFRACVGYSTGGGMGSSTSSISSPMFASAAE